MVELSQIHPLTDFLRNHKSHVARIHETRVPEILTINGKASLVLMDPESFQALLDRAERQEFIAAVREGIAAAERGELKPAEQVYAEMRARRSS